jgi:regulator of replication initiation timing
MTMEGNITEIFNLLKSIENSIVSMNKRAEGIEKRLERLEKVDSIEHRVTSNQIDITDIKDALERMEEMQSAKIENALKELLAKAEIKNNSEFSMIHKRLDSHLLKLGRVEEEILMVQQDK